MRKSVALRRASASDSLGVPAQTLFHNRSRLLVRLTAGGPSVILAVCPPATHSQAIWQACANSIETFEVSRHPRGVFCALFLEGSLCGAVTPAALDEVMRQSHLMTDAGTQPNPGQRLESHPYPAPRRTICGPIPVSNQCLWAWEHPNWPNFRTEEGAFKARIEAFHRVAERLSGHHGAAGPPHASLRYCGDGQRELAVQEPILIRQARTAGSGQDAQLRAGLTHPLHTAPPVCSRHAGPCTRRG